MPPALHRDVVAHTLAQGGLTLALNTCELVPPWLKMLISSLMAVENPVPPNTSAYANGPARPCPRMACTRQLWL